MGGERKKKPGGGGGGEEERESAAECTWRLKIGWVKDKEKVMIAQADQHRQRKSDSELKLPEDGTFF